MPSSASWAAPPPLSSPVCFHPSLALAFSFASLNLFAHLHFLSFLSLVFLSICFSPASSLGLGAAYGTAKAGVGVANMGVIRPELVMRSIIPIIMAGVLGIYGLIVAVIISSNMKSSSADPGNFQYDGFAYLAAGLSVGLCALAAGMAIGIVGDAGVRATAQQPKLFVGMILILIFAEALGLYGLIIALILSTSG